MTKDELRKLLADPQKIESNPFQVLKGMTSIINDPTLENEGRDLVLRALENKAAFGDFNDILNDLTREVGLFPYLDKEKLSLPDAIAYEYHKPLASDDFVFHREQAYIYRRLLAGESVVLSAPTSFGKSRIIDEIISLNRYKNIAVIVPTIALIDETRRRLSKFSDSYKVVTQVGQEPADKNLFIFTAERLNVYEELPHVDFFVIDEFYKLGNIKVDESRAVSLNQAFYRLLKGGGQFFLLGPSIKQVSENMEEKCSCHFYCTPFATVASDQHYVGSDNREERLVEICQRLNEPTLIFCSSPGKVNEVAKLLAENLDRDTQHETMAPCYDWVSQHYHPDWIFGKALLKGIGIHHGRLPRSLGQYVVRKFNDLSLNFLICTSTLIEGVNTKAKNVIVYDNEIARKKIDFFTFNNIKGRSGRMFEHFVGRVFLFDHPPQEQLPLVDIPIVTQDDDVPDSLLIQMEPEDLSERSKERLDEYTKDGILPVYILRKNSGIEPSDQFKLANAILRERKFSLLSWSSMPTYDQLKYACNLIWTHFQKKPKQGVYSGNQLTLMIWKLSQKSSIKNRIANELQPGEYAAKGPDEAVERILSFDRNWASYDFPRYLMALSRIQEHILPQAGARPGDYHFYAAKVESLFDHPLLNSLDEFGIPPMVGQKVVAALKGVEDIDKALEILKGAKVRSSNLHEFEREVLLDSISAM